MPRVVIITADGESLLIFRREMLESMARVAEVVALGPAIYESVSSKLQSLGVSYKTITLARTGINPVLDLCSVISIYRQLRSIQPSHVFSYGAKSVIYGTIAASLAGVRNIYCMVTGVGSNYVNRDLKSRIVCSLQSWLYRLALARASKVFFQNTDDLKLFQQRGIFKSAARTVMINGSGVNLEYFTELPIATNPVVFLMIARLIKTKGLLEYLAAAKLVKSRYPEAKFLLVGWKDNKDEAIGLELIEQHVEAGTIEYLGKLTDVRPQLARSSVYVLPSYREGTPKSVLEAMAAGRPIITTDAPGCRQTVVNGENGFLVPVANVEALVQAMTRFIEQPELAAVMGARSRQRAVADYDVLKVNKVILTAMALPCIDA